MQEKIAALARETRTVFSITGYVRSFIEETYLSVWEERFSHLQKVFNQVGEPAYGAFGRALFQPLGGILQQYGLTCDHGLPGTLQTSLERWGPPEERERCLWTVIRDTQGLALGTIVTRLFHDHTRFRLPHPPKVFALEATETASIIEALGQARIRITGGDEQRGAFLQQRTADVEGGWEYSVDIGVADSLDRGRQDLTEGLLDHALSHWGHYGWELTGVVSHQGQLLAFFKRPLRRVKAEAGQENGGFNGYHRL